MSPKLKKTLVAVSIAAAVAALAVFSYRALKKTCDKMLSSVTKNFSDKIGVRTRYDKTSFSVFRGIRLEGVEVFNASSGEKFFSAAEVVLKLDLSEALSGKAVISDIIAEEASVAVKRENGIWNFSEILRKARDLSPSELFSGDLLIAAPGLEISVNGRKKFLLKFPKAVFKKRTSKTSLYEASLSGEFPDGNGKPLCQKAEVELIFSMKNGAPTFLSFSGAAKEISWKDFEISSLSAKTEAFNVKVPAFKIKADLNAEGVFIPQAALAKGGISEKLNEISKIFGSDFGIKSDIKASEANLTLFISSGMTKNEFFIRSNAGELKQKAIFIFPENSAEISVETNLLGKKTELRMRGNRHYPETKPEFSYSMRKMLVKKINFFFEKAEKAAGFLGGSFPEKVEKESQV